MPDKIISKIVGPANLRVLSGNFPTFGIVQVDPWVVMRLWGRIGESQHGLATPCESEEDVRKLARQLVRQKLKRGYQIVTPRLPPARP